jgi:hypothetical protein
MSGEFNGFLVIGVIWFLLNLMTSGRKKPSRESRPTPFQPPRPRPTPTRPDATQQEGLRLEQVLGELRRTLEQAGSPPRQATIPGPKREQPERGGSLEVGSLEDTAPRQLRRPVDLDDEAAAVEEQRILAAESRNAPRAGAVQPIAAQQVIQQPADHTATRAYSVHQLRQAMIWREILDPPVSMR